MLHNIAYGTGLNGSWTQYLYKVWRYIWLPFYSTRRLLRMLRDQNADVLILLEVDDGSIRNRFRSQVKKFAKRLKHTHFYSALKYHPKSIWKYLIYFKKQHDAVLSKIKGEYKAHYIKSGMKKLVQEFTVNGISIFTVHMGVLSKTIRQMQFGEIANILKKCPRPFILCGDFNIHKGLDELKEFINQTGLKRIEMSPTFPSHKPKRYLDLFFISPGIEIKDFGIVKSEVSDHLPVWITI